MFYRTVQPHATFNSCFGLLDSFAFSICHFFFLTMQRWYYCKNCTPHSLDFVPWCFCSAKLRSLSFSFTQVAIGPEDHKYTVNQLRLSAEPDQGHIWFKQTTRPHLNAVSSALFCHSRLLTFSLTVQSCLLETGISGNSGPILCLPALLIWSLGRMTRSASIQT